MSNTEKMRRRDWKLYTEPQMSKTVVGSAVPDSRTCRHGYHSCPSCPKPTDFMALVEAAKKHFNLSESWLSTGRIPQWPVSAEEHAKSHPGKIGDLPKHPFVVADYAWLEMRAYAQFDAAAAPIIERNKEKALSFGTHYGNHISAGFTSEADDVQALGSTNDSTLLGRTKSGELVPVTPPMDTCLDVPKPLVTKVCKNLELESAQHLSHILKCLIPLCTPEVYKRVGTTYGLVSHLFTSYMQGAPNTDKILLLGEVVSRGVCFSHPLVVKKFGLQRFNAPELQNISDKFHQLWSFNPDNPGAAVKFLEDHGL